MQNSRAIVKTPIAPDAALICPRCGSDDIATTPASPPHHAEARCLECRRHWYITAPWTYEREKNFCMPYGKYRGHRLADLIETSDGLSYVRWLATRDAGNASIAARIMLEHVDEKRMSS
jgi:uncharacterized protein (DUF3820 family)